MSANSVNTIHQYFIFATPLARPTRSHVRTRKKEHMQTLLQTKILVPHPEKYWIMRVAYSSPQTEWNGTKWNNMDWIQFPCCITCSSSSELLLFFYESQSSYYASFADTWFPRWPNPPYSQEKELVLNATNQRQRGSRSLSFSQRRKVFHCSVSLNMYVVNSKETSVIISQW